MRCGKSFSIESLNERSRLDNEPRFSATFRIGSELFRILEMQTGLVKKWMGSDPPKRTGQSMLLEHPQTMIHRDTSNKSIMIM
jgi:hypothetical protein